jgi:AraC-like DNA-binding protein
MPLPVHLVYHPPVIDGAASRDLAGLHDARHGSPGITGGGQAGHPGLAGALCLAPGAYPLAQLLDPTQDQAAAYSRSLHYLRAIDVYLRERLAEEITLDAVAEHLGLHRRTLTRIMRQATGGSTVMHRLRTIRMRKAAELLCHTALSLTEIACRVGFPELSYFDRCFHVHYHCTPSTYRQQMRDAIAAQSPRS